jgi:hypothetical protein
MPSLRLLLIRSTLDGRDRYDYRTRSRTARRLTEIISNVPGIQLAGYVEGSGKELFEVAKTKGMEVFQSQCSSFHRVRFVRLFFGVHDGVNDGRFEGA